MDMLEIGRGLSQAEEETHFGLWCIMSSPLLIGCDLTTIPDRSLKLLKNKELIAINQDVLGLQAYPVQYQNGCYVLVKDLKKKYGKERAVALYNPTEEEQIISISLQKLGYTGKVTVYNATRQTPEATVEEMLNQKVVPHGTVILRLSGQRTEQLCYEGEHAYLHQFVAWEKEKAHYQNEPNASGGKKIVFLGKGKENYAEWRNVYSEKGGRYELTLYYYCDDHRDLTVTVNGKEIQLYNLNSGLPNARASVTIPILLQKGENTIRMNNENTWAPDIDAFTLRKL